MTVHAMARAPSRTARSAVGVMAAAANSGWWFTAGRESMSSIGWIDGTASDTLAVPSIHPMLDIDSLPAVNHQPEFAAAAITPTADRAVRDGALAMAWTVIDLATDDALRSELAAS